MACSRSIRAQLRTPLTRSRHGECHRWGDQHRAGAIGTGAGSGPYGVAVDTATGLVYVTNRDRNTVSVIEDTLCKPPPEEITILHAGTRPTIDGDMTEWQPLAQTLLNRDTASSISGVVPNPAKSDLSAGLRSAWASDTLYFAAAITDDVLVGNNSPQIWGDDAIELGIRVGNTTHQFTVAIDGRQADQGSPITSLAVMAHRCRRLVAGGRHSRRGAGPDPTQGRPVYPFTFGLWDDDLRPIQARPMIWRGTSTNTYAADWGTLALSDTVYNFRRSYFDPNADRHAHCDGHADEHPTATLTATPDDVPISTPTPTASPTATPWATLFLPLILR